MIGVDDHNMLEGFDVFNAATNDYLGYFLSDKNYLDEDEYSDAELLKFLEPQF